MIIPAWLRSWAGVTAVLALAFGIIGTLTLILEIGSPFGSFLSYSVALDKVGHVAVATPGWWPIYQVDPDFGGDLLTINGLPFTSNVRAEFARAQPGDLVTIELIRQEGDAVASVAVPVDLFSLAYFLEIKLPDVIVAVAFAVLGIIVLRSDPQAVTNQVFSAMSLGIFAHRMLNVHTLFIDNTLMPNFLEATLRATSALIVATAFHFAWVYPTPLPNRPRWLITLFYVVTAITGLALVAARITWWPPGITPPNLALNTIAFDVLLYLLLIAMAAIIVRLIWSAFRHDNTRREKRVLSITAIGILLAAPLVILMTAEVIPGLETNFYFFDLDLRFLLIGLPLAIALAIIRYQNLAGPSKAFVFVAILATSALLANVTAWIWRLAQPSAGVAHSHFVPLFAAIFGASLFWSLQTTRTGWLGRFLQREEINYAATRNLGRRLQAQGDLRNLPQTIAEAIAAELELNYTAVWLANRRSGQFALSAVAGQRPPPLPDQLAWPQRVPQTPSIRLAGSKQAPGWLRPLLVEDGPEIVTPLYDDAEPLALLGFGARWDEEVFDSRDLIVMELIGQQVQLYLQVARQIDELRQVPSQISTAQERERTLLAAELHDTIQQFLGRLPFFLMASKQAMADDPQEAADLLERSLRDIQDAAMAVQQIRQNLAPSQLDHSLSRALNSLAAHTHQRHAIEVPLVIEGDVDSATLLPTRFALYRVIQHALDNAVQHAQTDSVDVALYVENGRVSFVVSDDGRGATPNELWLARTTGHFGLQSMQARIEACGGELAFRTSPGEGTRVSGWVPVAVRTAE